MKTIVLFGDLTPSCPICGHPLSEDKLLRLRLRQTGPYVHLSVVDARGNPIEYGTLVTVTEDLKMFRNPSVSPGIGFPLDSMGRVILKD